jgi:hypothetical protein
MLGRLRRTFRWLMQPTSDEWGKETRRCPQCGAAVKIPKTSTLIAGQAMCSPPTDAELRKASGRHGASN